MQISNNKIIWDKDDWLRGLGVQDVNFGTARPTPGLSYMEASNPFDEVGAIAPGYYPVNFDVDDDLTAPLKSGAVYRQGFIAVCNDDLLARVDLVSGITVPELDTGTTDGVAWPYSINSGDAQGEDVASYDSNVTSASTSTFFYSWRNPTGLSATWDVGRYDGVNGTIDDDFMSTVPTGAGDFDDTNSDLPHPLEVGDDDVLYIGDGRYVHAYDGGQGANGTFFEEVLTLPSGYVITAFARISDYLVVFAYKKTGASNTFYYTQAKAFFWDYLNLDPTYVFDLNDNYVGEAIEYNGTVACFTEGRTNDLSNSTRFASLKVFDGTKFESVASWYRRTPSRGGAFSQEDAIWFAANNDLATGNVYLYGRPFNELNNGFYNLHAIGSSSQLIAQPNSFYLIVSGGTTKAAYLKSNLFGDGTASTPSAMPVAPDGQICKLTYVKINFLKSNTTDDVTKFTFLVQNENGQTIALENGNQIRVGQSNKTIQYNIEDYGEMFFNSLKCTCDWEPDGSGNPQTQVVASIEAGFEFVNINNLE